jgi:hypothetical protein
VATVPVFLLVSRVKLPKLGADRIADAVLVP